MSGQLSPFGATPGDDDLRGISGWILDDGVGVLCPEGMRQLTRGVNRLLDEKAALGRVAEAAREYLLAENADVGAILALACGNGSAEDQAEARSAADRAAIALGDALDDLDGKQR